MTLPMSPEKRPWYKKWWVVIALGVLVAFAFLGSLGGSEEPTPDATTVIPVAAAIPTTTEAPPTTTTSTTEQVTTTTTTTTTTTATLPQVTEMDMESLLILYLRDWSAGVEYFTIVDAMSDDEILDLGYTTCSLLESGASTSDVFLAILVNVDDPRDQVDAASMFGASTAALCPEYRYKFEE